MRVLIIAISIFFLVFATNAVLAHVSDTSATLDSHTAQEETDVMMENMMGNWGHGSVWQWQFGSLLVWLLYIVWLAVGVLAVIWLWREITKKQS